MKLVAAMAMRNESDILESWVRYYARQVDHIIITDNLSVDGSVEIAEALQANGIQITLLRDDRVEHLQQVRMTGMMKRAAEELGADWVLLLDADEFLVPPDRGSLRDCFAGLNPQEPVLVPWRTFVPTGDDNPTEVNPAKRIANRLVAEAKAFHKIMVPRSVALRRKALVEMGNHGMKVGGRSVKPQPAPEGLYLAHFPVRSFEQLQTKVLVGWLASLCRAAHREGTNYHWKLLFDQFISHEKTEVDLSQLARNYLGTQGEDMPEPAVMTDPVPARLLTFPLEETVLARPNAFEVFARTAEDIASTFGKMNARLAKSDNSPVMALKQLASTLVQGHRS